MSCQRVDLLTKEQNIVPMHELEAQLTAIKKDAMSRTPDGAEVTMAQGQGSVSPEPSLFSLVSLVSSVLLFSSVSIFSLFSLVSVALVLKACPCLCVGCPHTMAAHACTWCES